MYSYLYRYGSLNLRPFFTVVLFLPLMLKAVIEQLNFGVRAATGTHGSLVLLGQLVARLGVPHTDIKYQPSVDSLVPRRHFQVKYYQLSSRPGVCHRTMWGGSSPLNSPYLRRHNAGGVSPRTALEGNIHHYWEFVSVQTDHSIFIEAWGITPRLAHRSQQVPKPRGRHICHVSSCRLLAWLENYHFPMEFLKGTTGFFYLAWYYDYIECRYSGATWYTPATELEPDTSAVAHPIFAGGTPCLTSLTLHGSGIRFCLLPLTTVTTLELHPLI